MRPGVRDAGLQPERTRLAWRRTTLTYAVAALLAGRQALHGGTPSPLAAMAVALGALTLAVLLAVAHRRIRSLDVPRPPALAPRTAVATVGCTIALALLGVAVVV
jgi:hypothetical protein